MEKEKNVMSAETVQVSSVSTRLTMAACLNMGVTTFVTNAMLPRCRSLWEISLYWSVKALLQSFFWAMFCHIIIGRLSGSGIRW